MKTESLTHRGESCRFQESYPADEIIDDVAATLRRGGRRAHAFRRGGA